MTYQFMPKVEIHHHIEGAAPPKFIASLAREKNIDISRIFDADGNYCYNDFAAFLSTYEAACEPLIGPQEFYRLTKVILAEAADHGVVYLETFISPDFCGGGDMFAWRDYVAAIEQAATESERDAGIILRGIATAVRHFGPDKATSSVRCAAETKGDFIVGFGMGGAETHLRPRDFVYAFDIAREAGLQLTCHAGEWGGSEMVAETIHDLGVNRIGHGIHVMQDPNLVAEAVEKGIVFEVCPGSNVSLGAVAGWDVHPIVAMRDAGLKVTVSTDDPPFFHTTMTHEFAMLNKTFGWDAADFDALNNTALAAAYCDDITRSKITKKIGKTK